MKPCSSCHGLFADEEMDSCPACRRLTCSTCQCPDEDGAFVICQDCADQLIARGLAEPAP